MFLSLFLILRDSTYYTILTISFITNQSIIYYAQENLIPHLSAQSSVMLFDNAMAAANG